jgi:HEAT repeat protein
VKYVNRPGFTQRRIRLISHRIFTLCTLLLTTLLVSAQELKGRFYAEKDSYMLGEPLFFSMEIKNTGNELVYLNARKGECLDKYEFSLQKAGFTGSTTWDNQCHGEPLPLKPGETDTSRWPLDFWFRVEHEGKFNLTVTRRMRTSSVSRGITELTFSSTFEFNVVPSDEQGVQKVLQDFERNLHSDDPEIRHNALDVMSTTAPTYFHEIALRLAHDKDVFNVLHAIGALRRMNTPEGRVALADILATREANSEDEITARANAIQALGESEDESYLALVTPYVRDTSEHIQLAAMIAVAKLGNEPTVPQLQRLLLSPDPITRKNAAFALRFSINPSAVDALIGDLTDKDPTVRGRILTSLTELTGHSVPIASNRNVSSQVVQNLWRAWWQHNGARTSLSKGTWVPVHVP